MSAPAAAALRARAKQVRQELKRLQQEGPGEPAVHDFRVASRRLVAAIDLAGDLMPDLGLRRARKRVRRRFKRVGDLRDVQVQRGHLRAFAGDDPALAAVAARLTAEETARREALTPWLRRRRPDRDRGAFQAARRRLAQLDEAAMHAGLRDHVAARVERAEAALAAAADGGPAELHALRIALKKVRYALEAAADVAAPRGFKARLNELKRWQDVLGYVQDLAVLHETVDAGGAAVDAIAAAQARALDTAWAAVPAIAQTLAAMRRLSWSDSTPA